MKKFLLVLSLAGCLFAAAPVQAAGTGTDSEIADKLLLYIPNRLVDALDMFTVNLGIGPVIEAQLMATRAIWGGAGIGLSYKAYKAHNRQYGFGVEEGWYWSFIFVSDENYSVVDSTSLVKKYIENRSGFPTPDMRIYDFFEGKRDYWAIGGSLGCLVTGDLYIHPVEWVDFALGFFFIDIKGDDFTFDSFR